MDWLEPRHRRPQTCGGGAPKHGTGASDDSRDDPCFVRTARPDGALDFITGSFFAQTGLRNDETLLWEWTAVLHPEDRERTVQDWQDAMAEGRAPDQEMRIRSQDGTYRWFLASAAPLRDDTAILRWYGTFTDIDGRKRAEQKLQMLKDQLDKENIALRDEISQTSMFKEIVGSSGALRRVLMLVGAWTWPKPAGASV